MSGNRERGGESVVYLLPKELPLSNWLAIAGVQL